LAPSTEAQIKIFVVPVLVAIVLGLATVAVGLALYIWNESRASSEAYRSLRC
jgi:multisubunit Na+/H+ antiporter MnhC subunit